MNLRALTIVSAGCVALAGCGGPAVSAGSTSAPDNSASPSIGVATITASDFFGRISFLASDVLGGRDTPSRGLDVAAAYLVSEYLRLGLEPAGEHDSFYQWYPFPELALDTTTVHFGTVIAGENRMLRYGDDFFVTAVAGDAGGGRAMNHARLVYVGSGADGLPAVDYTDAAPVITMPASYDRDWRLAVSRARAAAAAAGANALVVVVAPDFPEARFRQLAAASRAARRQIPVAGEIPVVYLTYAAAVGIAERAGLDVEALDGASGPVPIEGVDAHFAAHAVATHDGMAPNVVAILPGSDPALRDEYVVLSAHMDHVGIGRPVDGDSIYNGADDNASGTTALVEIAEALASLAERPRRSIVFLHVSGEEHGLLGSRWYSDHPTVPLERTVANINVDMIARNSPDSVVVIGKDFSSLGGVVDAVAARHPEVGLVVSDDIWPEERFFFRSDHFNFARKEVPSIFFFSGVHEDYHRPSDEVHTLDTDKAARVARMIFHTLVEIANAPGRPTWDPVGLEQVRALTR